MKITNVTVSMARRIVKNYQSFENSVAMGAELSEGDDPHGVVRELQKECFNELLKQYPYDRPRKKPAETKAAVAEQKGEDQGAALPGPDNQVKSGRTEMCQEIRPAGDESVGGQ